MPFSFKVFITRVGSIQWLVERVMEAPFSGSCNVLYVHGTTNDLQFVGLITTASTLCLTNDQSLKPFVLRVGIGCCWFECIF